MKSLPKGRARLAQSCLFDDPRRSLASGFLTLIKSGDPPARCGPAELSAPAERQAIADAQRIVLEASDIEQIRSDLNPDCAKRTSPRTPQSGHVTGSIRDLLSPIAFRLRSGN